MRINDKLIDQVAKRLDEAMPIDKWIKGVPGQIIEMVDGWIAKIALHGFNNRYGDKIPEEYDDDIRILLEAFASDDYSNITRHLMDRVNEAIDIPFLDEEEEGTILALLVSIITNLVADRSGL